MKCLKNQYLLYNKKLKMKKRKKYLKEIIVNKIIEKAPTKKKIQNNFKYYKEIIPIKLKILLLIIM